MLRNSVSALLRQSLAASARQSITNTVRVAMPQTMAVRAASMTATPPVNGAASDSLSSEGEPIRTISNPTLANIEKRWEGMPLQEQADLWMALRDRMQGSWHDLTVQEKKAGE